MMDHTTHYNRATAVVQTFLDALERKDLETAEAVLDAHIVQTIPYGPTGASQPWVVNEGKEQVLGYLETVFTNFSQVSFPDRTITISADEQTVFVEVVGDLVTAQRSQPYHNVYVFKFELRDGRIYRFAEYANPVTIAKVFGVPVG
jgi:ketosteroid isomerase-like protein